MNRWAVAEPEERSGAWEGEMRLVSGGDTKARACGHLHETSAEATRCAQVMADRLNELVPLGAVPAQRVPPGHYLG